MQAALKIVLKPAVHQSLLSAQKSESWGSKVNDGVAEEGKGREEKVQAGHLTTPSLSASNVKWWIRKPNLTGL